ncbi:MAG: GDSL-type esterase/lipase family protein [Clostridiales bacterium]|jgi:hypothetical protein|nr:GDSL-type esterase/lipase family protein [Clostridiales bacterium]MDR2750451.1 GDSL-type esterase/lipase family protein [Clostridiales bacterium]
MGSLEDGVLVPHNSSQLAYCGRIKEKEDSKEFIWPGSYVKIRFRGTGISALVRNNRAYYDNSVGFLLDGEYLKLNLADSPDICIVSASSLPEGEHDLILYKRMDLCHYFDFLAFVIDEGGEILDQPPLPGRRIEAYGDSITCGELSEAYDYVGMPDPTHTGEFSNSFYSYAALTAQALNARLHNNSQGGLALLDNTGYFRYPEALGLESLYKTLRPNPQLGPVEPWDFSFKPHLILLAIGQNDAYPDNYMARDYNSRASAFWRKRYIEFVKTLRKINPQADIICMTTILMHEPAWDEAIDEACLRLSDPKVHRFRFTRNGIGTPGHVRKSEAEEMAGELVPFIESLDLDWPKN